jgi:hypothetical protein
LVAVGLLWVTYKDVFDGELKGNNVEQNVHASVGNTVHIELDFNAKVLEQDGFKSLD